MSIQPFFLTNGLLECCPLCKAPVTGRSEHVARSGRHSGKRFDVYRFGCLRSTNPDPTIDSGMTVVHLGNGAYECVWDCFCRATEYDPAKHGELQDFNREGGKDESL